MWNKIQSNGRLCLSVSAWNKWQLGLLRGCSQTTRLGPEPLFSGFAVEHEFSEVNLQHWVTSEEKSARNGGPQSQAGVQGARRRWLGEVHFLPPLAMFASSWFCLCQMCGLLKVMLSTTSWTLETQRAVTQALPFVDSEPSWNIEMCACGGK